MIKNFLVGNRPFTVFPVSASFPFPVYLFCFVFVFFLRIKTKTQSESFLSINCQKKWNLGRNLYIFIHSLINSKSNELPQFGPPLKQMNG